jgi:NADH dehydrogenase FAD-containing subunit
MNRKRIVILGGGFVGVAVSNKLQETHVRIMLE